MVNINSIHENKIHGSLSFPYIVYRGKLPEYISSFPLHWHEEIEIIFICKGHGLITVQTDQYECFEGDIIFISPEKLHSICQYSNESMEYFNILFKPSLLEENTKSICYTKYFLPLINNSMIISPFIPAGNELNKKITPFIKFLIEFRKNRDSGYELLIKSNLYNIMFFVNQNLVSNTQTHITKDKTIQKIKRVLTYVETNYSEDIPTSTASQLSGFCESHFMKLFKEITGLPFTKYLILYRLEIAANKLISSNEKIIDIAEDVGFHNFSYFIRSFEKKFNESPSNYRNKHRN